MLLSLSQKVGDEANKLKPTLMALLFLFLIFLTALKYIEQGLRPRKKHERKQNVSRDVTYAAALIGACCMVLFKNFHQFSISGHDKLGSYSA